MKTNKQELASTILSELKLYMSEGIESMHTFSDPLGNEDIFIRLNSKDEISAVASLVKKHGGRCVTVTPNVVDEGDEVAYHFCIEGVMLNAIIITDDKTVPSITPILKSADWTEREMNDLFDIKPVGHPNPKRLILDESIAEGIFKEYVSLSEAMAGAATCSLWENLDEAKQGESHE